MNAFAMATANSDLQTNSILVASFAAIKNKARASTEATSELAARVFDAVLAPKGPGSGNGPRRPAREFHRDRAVLCINQDWLGPEPLFRDNEFQRQFRVTKDIFRRMEEELPFHNGFFRPVKDAIKTRKPIDPRVKMICALKVLAFGTSAIANIDYLQISTSTAAKCLVQFCTTLARKSCFSKVYLRDMNALDAKRVTEMHKRVTGIDGIIGALDCMHVVWKNCPYSHQGVNKRGKSKPSLILEGMADYNLWIWHGGFGDGGSLNDINVWDKSHLKTLMVSDDWNEKVEKPFEIAGETFYKYLILVDGIYPNLARFVKTLGDGASTPSEKRFTKWQEAIRKLIERAFGVLQIKFQYLARPVHLRNPKEIGDVVRACIILHNMMVEYRIENCDCEAVHAMSYKLDAELTRMEEDERMEYVDRAAERARRGKQDLLAMAAEMDRGAWFDLRTTRMVREAEFRSLRTEVAIARYQ